MVSFLSGEAGTALLDEADCGAAEVEATLMRLRRRHPPPLAAAALQMAQLRRRARPKFPQAHRMFFTREGLEQSSGHLAAAWRASRFVPGTVILDLCCGIGGDSLALAERGKVLAFDRSPAACRCAAANARALGRDLAAACADVTGLRLRGDAAFFDPSRRTEGRRVTSPEDYAPPLSLVEEIRRRIPHLAVKVSPVLRSDATYRSGARIEFVSVKGECREAVLWYGEIGPAEPRSAAVLPAGARIAEDTGGPPAEVRPPGDWLFEPDAAVVRAHLIDEAASLIGGWKIDPHIAYLSSSSAPDSPFGTAYKILDVLPFSLTRIAARLRQLDARVDVVKRRGVPMEPEEIARRLRRPAGRPVVLVLTRIEARSTAILCERAPPDAE